jgi:hypothetical protein
MSNKKNLLNESQVRQFMKLASLQPLTPGFVHGLTEKAAFKKGQETEAGGKADEEDLEEGHGRGANEYHEAGVHRGGGIKLDEEGMQYRDDAEAELGATEDELGAEDELAGEEGEEVEDLEGEVDVEADAGAEPSLTVAQVVDAIENALQDLLPDEEVEAEYVGDEEGGEPSAEDEFAPGGDEVVADVELGEEADLEEAEKDWAAIVGGGKVGGSLKPDPKKGEKDYTPTAASIAKARADKSGTSPRDKFPRRSGGGGGWKPVVQENSDELVEQITKRVAARILKAALAKK